MKIKIDTTTLTNEDNAIFGKICFYENEFFFPDKDWNDFVIIILNWWSTGLFKLLKNESLTEEFLFMDGPFAVKVSRLEENKLNLFFNTPDSTIKICEVTIDNFLKEFLIQINNLLEKLNKLNFYNDDVRDLSSNYEKLRVLSKNQ